MSWADELNPELQQNTEEKTEEKQEEKQEQPNIKEFKYVLTEGSGKVLISNKDDMRSGPKKTVTMHLSADLVAALQKQPATRTLSVEALLRFALQYLQTNNKNLEI